jgi:hypothetical protein
MTALFTRNSPYSRVSRQIHSLTKLRLLQVCILFFSLNTLLTDIPIINTDVPSTVLFASPIANTPIEESIKKRNTCAVCGTTVKDTDRQIHLGEHILKALLGVQDLLVKVNVSCLGS